MKTSSGPEDNIEFTAGGATLVKSTKNIGIESSDGDVNIKSSTRL
jgi:hypothetical protein